MKPFNIKDIYPNTRDAKKLWNYFLAVSDSDDFMSKVRKIREKYHIPLKGYSDKNLTFPPLQWPGEKGRILGLKLDDDLIRLCKQYNLHFFQWEIVLETLVVYNVRMDARQLGEGYLCQIADFQNEKDDPLSLEAIKINLEYFPLGIRISPYASKRDILDFVEKSFWLIKSVQDRYMDKNIKIGKFKSRNKTVRTRDSFIYLNRHMPLVQIAKKVEKKFNQFLDEGHIAKIISIEKKRRKKL